jgi:LPXTG-site transpeptidase (sortase) family protein
LIPPSDPQQLGWWSDGAKTGAKQGSALITGHTVHTGGGALDNLERLRPGDRVTVRTGRGAIAYDVRTVQVYRKGSVARHAERLFSQEVAGRLVLVTCEDWDGTRYLSNVVVVARPSV